MPIFNQPDRDKIQKIACAGAKFRPFLYGILCFAISACGLTAPEKTPAPFLTAEQFISSIYTLPDPDSMVFYDPERRPLYYSRSIVEKSAKAEQCYKEKYGMPHLDFSYITIGGDYDMAGLSITTQKKQEDKAQVRVSFGAGDYYTELYYRLIATPEGWRVDNVVTSSGYSLADSLSEACQAPEK